MLDAGSDDRWSCRYLAGWGGLVQEFVRQIEEQSHIAASTDSEHAGCVRTLKSTSSSKLFNSSHLLHSTTATQAVISLSPGE